MSLLHAILAAMLGTYAMTWSSTTEMQWRGRAPSVVPGMATNKLLRIVGVPTLEGRALKILSEWTHWVYGAAWGVVYWLLVDADIGDLNTVVAGVIFFFIVWIVEQIELPLLRIGVPWSWTWGLKENLIDAWHHVVFAAGTVAAWELIDYIGS